MVSSVPEEEARRKPSIRTLTVRYILALLKYLHEGAKNDMLRSRPFCVALFSHLADDPADVITDILNVTEQSVLKDDALQRSAKSTLLLQYNLERVNEVATRSREDHPAAERAFAWLKAVCTKDSYGVLRSNGWYPPSTSDHDAGHKRSKHAIDLGLDSLESYDQSERPDVRNTTLLGWIQTLRPHADPKERELIITCFEAAPELVAAYFGERNMQLEPKLTNTWLGYASFLFEVVRLQVPEHFGNSNYEDGENQSLPMPPQTSIILENLLPRPLTQKVLARCLNQSSELITFFVIRLLVLAFRKLSTVLTEMRNASEVAKQYQSLWEEASERLLARFTERVPPMKDIIGAFRKIPDDEEHAMQREASARLLRLSYEVTPVQALEEQFDVSAALTAALARSSSETATSEISELRAIELQHLLVIAKHSPGMKWFSKQGGLDHSPLVSLLRLHLGNVRNTEIRMLLWDVLSRHDLLASDSELDALLASLLAITTPTDELWSFIDECLARASRQPVKYVDQLESSSTETLPKDMKKRLMASLSDHLPGLMAAAVAEQAAFAKGKQNTLHWAAFFLDLVFETGHTKAAGVLSRAVSALPAAVDHAVANTASREVAMEQVRLPQPDVAMEDYPGAPKPDAFPRFTPPPKESDSRPELLRWAQKDLALAFEDGDISALVLCLCSSHPDIVRQGHAQLRSLTLKLHTTASTALDSKDHLAVLLGELLESFEHQYLPANQPLPYLAGVFATKALNVLQNPTHHIYPKLNRYLIKSPEWRITRLPAYWLSNTLHSQPEEDDAYWKEINWVLSWLIEGLRTPADLEILRRGGSFEKVMGLYCSPGAAAAGRRGKVGKGTTQGKVVELLYRGTCVEGGSRTLVTRAGVLAWLDIVGRRAEGGSEMIDFMKARVLETADGEKMRVWKGL